MRQASPPTSPAPKLGLAYQIAFIRLTGRAPGQQPFEILEDLVGYVATELNANPRDLDLYARRRERSVQDICEVVASVMAYGCNIGPETMARVTNDVSYKAIRRLADWQFSEDKLHGALADLVNGISRCDAAEVWGHARTSSSDGQRYLFPRKTLKATYSHRHPIRAVTSVGKHASLPRPHRSPGAAR